MHFFIFIVLLCSSVFAQSESIEIEKLRKEVQELSEITAEQGELIKRQLKDQHYDQSSRGYLEIKVGRSMLAPDDVEDENDDVFNDTDDANWESFDYGNILDVELGKSLLSDTGIKHEIAIGYQYLRSKRLEASFTPNAGPPKTKVFETISAHTLFLRYAQLHKLSTNENFRFGPGITFGFAPVTELVIEVERNDVGEQVTAENTSFLVEVFGKAKYDFTRYFSIVGTFGYRLQEAENVRLNSADVVSLKTKTDLDLSGVFGTFGIATSF